MGTKRRSWSLFDSLSYLNAAYRNRQPGGRLSRESSPRPETTIHSEQEQERKQAEEGRRERDLPRMNAKTRTKVDRYLERDQPYVPTATEGERERRAREERCRNKRPVSNLEPETEKEAEVTRGCTFPRTEKASRDREEAALFSKKVEGRRLRERPGPDDWERERAWRQERRREDERHRDRARERTDRARERTDRTKGKGEANGGRPPEDGGGLPRGRRRELEPEYPERRGEQYAGVSGQRDRRERDVARERAKHRTGEGERRGVPSSPRRREKEVYADGAMRRAGLRDTRSEGDNDGGIARERDGAERYHHSRSEGETSDVAARESEAYGDKDGRKYKDRGGEREVGRVRGQGEGGKMYRGREIDREMYRERGRGREADREVGRKRERGREADREVYKERGRGRVADREVYKERGRGIEVDREVYKERGRGIEVDREVYKERGRGIEVDREVYRERGVGEEKFERGGKGWRERGERRGGEQHKRTGGDQRREGRTDRRREDAADSGSRSPDAGLQGRSSGERSSERDSENRGRDSYDERESERGSSAESERGRGRGRSEGSTSEKLDGGEERTGIAPEQRRMWLEPENGKPSNRSSVDDDLVERGTHSGELGAGRRIQEPEEKYRDQTRSRERRYEGGMYRERGGATERGTEGVSGDEKELSEAWGRGGKGEGEPLSDSDGGAVESRSGHREREGKAHNAAGSDKEDERGSSESTRGSEDGRERRTRGRLSVEDDFVTVSSGGDGEEEFEDCRDYWEAGSAGSKQLGSVKEHEGDGQEKWREESGKGENGDSSGKGKRPKYVFCVIGRYLSHTQTAETSETDRLEGVETNSGSDEDSDDNTHRARDYDDDDDDDEIVSKGKELSEGETSRRETPSEFEDKDIVEVVPTGKDSETARLLSEWRERLVHKMQQLSASSINPHGDSTLQENCVTVQQALDGANRGTRSLDLEDEEEQEVSIRIRMNRAWSLAEEVKQAPHLKWATTVVRDILGSSEEYATDDPSWGSQRGQKVSQYDRGIQKEEQAEQMQSSRGDRHNASAETDPLEVEALRGMGQSQADMHADQFTAHTMHDDTLTHTHTDTLLDTSEGSHIPVVDRTPCFSGDQRVERAADTVKVDVIGEGGDVRVAAVDDETATEKEVQMYLSVSNTLYKPNSCPSLSYALEPDVTAAAGDASPGDASPGDASPGDASPGDAEKRAESEVDPEERGIGKKLDEVSCGEGSEEESFEAGEHEEKGVAGAVVKSSRSFQGLSPELRMRRMGLRKTTERRQDELVEEEGVGRDRRTRIFTSDNEDAVSESWGEVELRNVLDTIGKRRRKSKYFKAAHQLYQQYSEAAQNNEILCQSHSDAVSTSEDHAAHLTVPTQLSSPPHSPSLSPRPSCRPLPPLPLVPHPHFMSLPHVFSNTAVSAKSLPLPELPKAEGRPPSPRLSIALGQSATLWQDLPGVRDCAEMDKVTEGQRRLQEVRFEVVTSEASYCRSLDIVVEQFVKSKQLGALLTTQDRNWLFSRLADVRAISHSFLSKLEERVDSDIMHFTVCDIIARHCPRFRMVYVPYLTNQSYQDATYQRLMNSNPGFKRTVEKLERSPVCQRLPLRSFLVLPFQRITRIKLLVQNIVKRTAPGTEDEIQAIKALKLLEKIIQESNDSISQMKNIESLVSLSSMVDFECRTLPLISQSRRLVREGPVTQLMEFSLKEGERSVYLHLFNDYLLVSLHKEGGRFVVIDHAPVSDLRAENCRFKLHSLQKNLLRLYLAQNALLLRTDTQSDKLRWISAVSRPHPEVDFSAAQDFKQMQCIRAFIAQQPDELSLEKADVILVHQQSSDGWVEGTKLSDRQHGWVPGSHLEIISNSRVRQHNLSDALKLTTARESTNPRQIEVLVTQ